MTAYQLIVLDLAAAFLATGGWVGAATALGTRGVRLAWALAGLAGVATVTRVGTTIGLGAAGWWFAQDRVVLTLPLTVVGGVVAVTQFRTRSIFGALVGAYGAAAGLVHPLLVGYPVTWSSALVTASLVGVAVVVTWRVLVGPVPASVIAVVAAIGLVGGGLAFLPSTPSLPATGPNRSVVDLRGPSAAAPGGAVRRFTLTAQRATIALASGVQVAAWTFNGQSPGPALTATEGDLIEVTLKNLDIDDGVTLHWHGYDVPNAEDGAPGVTQDEVRPGQEHVYRFLADQVGTYWYHTHQVSDPAVRMGLFGTLVVTRAPTGGTDLTLPVHTFGSTLAVGTHDDIDARTVPVGTPVRLRLVNTDSTPRRFALAGAAFRLVAVDGNDLSGPGELSTVTLRLPAGGRYDLAFTMPDQPVTLLVESTPRLTLNGAAMTNPDPGQWPELDPLRYGTPAPTPFGPDSQFDQRFTLVLDRGLALKGGIHYAHMVNGRAYPSTINQVVREGDLVHVTVVNRSMETHPWHLHGHRVLVLARDGQPPTGSPLWLDTFDVRPGEVWEVGFRATNPGTWMNHCHNLSHAELGMVTHLVYSGVTSPFHDAHH